MNGCGHFCHKKKPLIRCMMCLVFLKVQRLLKCVFLLKILILILFEQVSRETIVFHLQGEHLSYYFLPCVVTCRTHARFADSFVSITVHNFLGSYKSLWGFTAVLTVLGGYYCCNCSATIQVTKDLIAPAL